MKRVSQWGVFLSVGVLLLYVLLVKHHLGSGPQSVGRPAHRAADAQLFQYGVMFDAGSTGTRVHVFRFTVHTNAAPSLSQETFRAIEPGLSAYADDPDQCAAGILQLLEVAKSSVPPPAWSRTPAVLRATAGLRLLEGGRARELLTRVMALFVDSPFLSRDDSVSIMDGTDEGISAWITVNFLTGDLHRADSSTAGMLDLGGGSTQITFKPQDEKTIQTSPIDYIRSFQMFNNTHTVYTHSYLGLGLMSARLAVLGGAPPRGSRELVTPCLSPGSEVRWEHADVVYTVSGQESEGSVLEACRLRVHRLLSGNVLKVEADDIDFYAFSFYYDRAAELGLIEEQTGGSVRVSDYSEAAERVCGGVGASSGSSPFLCLDLLYISTLLQELGFPPHKTLKLARTIHQVETSWALGATFHYIESLNTH
ncbi:LOW QUALITY PROTEIN: ectonucleoside triphosphate diphosphohydrolase 6 [Trematomus bernacchii]|uniref:LOW QUALITY PROTEIN: ectonucleoside triphosphate diphosphohydrolase 6 n=1 Tax=Trematomus bernacchii TaxID=40690 RepID=UPI00146F10EB|nr:LOW QUALITY PROTEIN: ectonucleoside triphosphate diphosphohydrolase 6 [Trematomus bernacchii]